MCNNTYMDSTANAEQGGERAYTRSVRNAVFQMADMCRLDIVQRDDHPQSVKLFCDIASEFDIDVTDQDTTYWRAILNASREFDTLVDDDKVPDIQPYLESLIVGKTIPNFTVSQAEEFSTVYKELSVDRQATINASVQMVEFAHERYAARSIVEFIDVTVEEAEYFARLVAIDDDEVFQDVAQRKQFNSWLYRLGRTGYLLDSISDAKRDYENEIIQIRPTLKTQVTLGKYALSELGGCLSNAPAIVGPILLRAGFEKALRGVLKDSTDN